MGFFDFFKGKGKKENEETEEQLKLQETEQSENEETSQEEKELAIEGLEINPVEPKEEEIRLQVNKDTTVADIRNTVRSAMTENKIVIKLARVEPKEEQEKNEQEQEASVSSEQNKNEEIQSLKTEALSENDSIQNVTLKEENIEEKRIEPQDKIQEKEIVQVQESKEELAESEVKEVVEENIAKEEIVEEKKTSKKGFFAKLLAGLDKTRKSIIGGVDTVLGAFTKIDEDLFEELEEVLIMADLGVETTMSIIENLRKRVKREKTTNPLEIKGMLVDEITALLNEGFDENYEIKSPAVLLVIGVNGVGKTTTIGKLANNFKIQGKNVLLAAADTFRAAAIDQLEVWGKRAEIDVIKHQENSDPAAVIFDAVNAAKNRKTDVLICDTAGRLHNKKNLMEELKKISKVIDREYPEANKEVYLVLDATTGQNAMQQAKLFKEVTDITGIILTKLDGTAKGGIVIAIKSELKIPVRYIGVGEGLEDLQKFHAKDFAKALFGEE